MKKDIHIPKVTNVAIAIVNENEDRSMNESITHLGSNPLEEGHVHTHYQNLLSG